MIQLPAEPESDNIRQLAMWTSERQTGVTIATLTLANTPVQTTDGTQLERVHKNGTRLDPGTQYAIEGKVITLAVAAIAGDVFLIDYLYRS
jgi:hypothetical protein